MDSKAPRTNLPQRKITVKYENESQMEVPVRPAHRSPTYSEEGIQSCGTAKTRLGVESPRSPCPRSVLEQKTTDSTRKSSAINEIYPLFI